MSSILKRRGVKHQLLNAKFHETEAEIVSQAGQPGAVTVATNMAGRGTDIVLGPGVVEMGGVHILGTERHEARRIDNQLRGRSGRQGDPGSSKFYLSLDDDLMRIFGSDKIKGIMEKLGMEEGQEITHPWVSKAIERSQRTVEGHNFDIRKHLLEYDDVMNKQREVIYAERKMVLEGKDLKEHITKMIDDVFEHSIFLYCPEKVYPEEWNLKGLFEWAKNIFLVEIDIPKDEIVSLTHSTLKETIINKIMFAYEEKEKSLTLPVMRQLERVILLNTIDSKWKDHLYMMDRLKEGIGLRAYGQKDPLLEYKREGYDMFIDMMDRIKEEVTIYF